MPKIARSARGLPPPQRDIEVAVPRTKDGWAVPPEVAGSFDARNAADVQLHALADRLLDERLDAALPGWRSARKAAGHAH